eukprot:1159436-Pelagomonas_calceolata.AAC.6
MGCTKRKQEGPALGGCLNQELGDKRDKEMADACAVRTPPAPFRFMVQALPPLRVIWVQLLPIKLPGRGASVYACMAYIRQQ